MSYEVYVDNEEDVIFLQDGRGNISTFLAVSSGYQALCEWPGTWVKRIMGNELNIPNKQESMKWRIYMR